MSARTNIHRTNLVIWHLNDIIKLKYLRWILAWLITYTSPILKIVFYGMEMMYVKNRFSNFLGLWESSCVEEAYYRPYYPYNALPFDKQWSLIPNFMSIFRCLGHSAKESVHIWRSLTFCKELVFTVRGCQFQAEVPSLVIYLWLLFQYICCYPSLLEAFPPSASQGQAMLWWQGTPPNLML
jgi:hypothetical protein